MKLYSMLSGLALMSAGIATPAFAQSITPTGTNFTAVGTAVLMKTGFPTQTCTLTLTGNSGSGTSGTITGGTNTGGGLCPGITVDPSTFTITSTANPTTVNGVIAQLTVRAVGPTGPMVICSQANRPFTVDTSGVIVFNSTISPDCSVQARLTNPTVRAVP